MLIKFASEKKSEQNEAVGLGRRGAELQSGDLGLDHVGEDGPSYLEALVANPRTAHARRRDFSEIRARPLWLSFLQGPGGGAGRGSRATNLKVKAENSGQRQFQDVEVQAKFVVGRLTLPFFFSQVAETCFNETFKWRSVETEPPGFYEVS